MDACDADIHRLSERLTALERLVREWRTTDKEALHLQAAVYESRLAHLNDSAQRWITESNKLVSADLYNIQHQQTQDQLDRLARLVYVGLGIVLAIQFVIQVVGK